VFRRPLGRLIAALVLCSHFALAASNSASPRAVFEDNVAEVTLEECYARARQISETIGISAESTREAQAIYRAQVGAILPHIDWIGTQFYQEKVHNTATGIGGSALRSSQPESYFQLQQPLFAGFRDFNEAAILKSQREQAQINERLTDLQLLSDVSEAFYIAYTLQDQLKVLEETRKLNQDQIDQLSRWVDVGRSRPSELLSAQTQGASLDAQIEDTQRNLVAAHHNLEFLAAVPMETPLIDNLEVNKVLTVQEALERSNKRAELQHAQESVHQAQLGVNFAQGEHLPVLTFLGRYYTRRVGFLEPVDWDATFTLDVPIYYGGSTQANVRAARSQELIRQLELRHLRRDVDREVRTAYDNFVHSLSKAKAYDKAVQLARKNYTTQQKEYKLGVISNLELLQLLGNTQDLRRDSLVARAGAKIDDIRLRIAMGEGL